MVVVGEEARGRNYSVQKLKEKKKGKMNCTSEPPERASPADTMTLIPPD